VIPSPPKNRPLTYRYDTWTSNSPCSFKPCQWLLLICRLIVADATEASVPCSSCRSVRQPRRWLEAGSGLNHPTPGELMSGCNHIARLQNQISTKLTSTHKPITRQVSSRYQQDQPHVEDSLPCVLPKMRRRDRRLTVGTILLGSRDQLSISRNASPKQ